MSTPPTTTAEVVVVGVHRTGYVPEGALLTSPHPSGGAGQMR